MGHGYWTCGASRKWEGVARIWVAGDVMDWERLLQLSCGVERRKGVGSLRMRAQQSSTLSAQCNMLEYDSWKGQIMVNDPVTPPSFKREKQLGHATDQDIAKYVANFINKSKAAGYSAKQGSLWQQARAEGFPATEFAYSPS